MTASVSAPVAEKVTGSTSPRYLLKEPIVPGPATDFGNFATTFENAILPLPFSQLSSGDTFFIHNAWFLQREIYRDSPPGKTPGRQPPGSVCKASPYAGKNMRIYHRSFGHAGKRAYLFCVQLTTTVPGRIYFFHRKNMELPTKHSSTGSRGSVNHVRDCVNICTRLDRPLRITILNNIRPTTIGHTCPIRMPQPNRACSGAMDCS